MRESGRGVIYAEYSDIMRKAYIDYAMSVIISRALPDVRDGLKPVQRRTLYDMYELGVWHDGPFRKCARIVGDTMGKYHPHGDSSIYGALVVMAQGFKYNLPLVEGHGNFGSLEGDRAAAMRYTEARLHKIAQECYLTDLDKDVVDFLPNFDATEREPAVLPAKIPNLLVNGAEGIAVGMTTSIPSHNLGEVTDAMIACMKNPDISVEELLEIMPGPDFPTGGIVINKNELGAIYESGKGKIRLRGRAGIERIKGGRHRIVIDEIPITMAGAGVGKFLNDVSELSEKKICPEITDISNRSSGDKARIVIDLKKDADAEKVLNILYTKTRLEDSFGVNMLAVAKGRPEIMGLREMLRCSIDFQYERCTRKYRTLLEREEEKSEIQKGLIKACDVIDLIIEILRGSRNAKQARACLIEGNTEGIRFKSQLSKKMASALCFTPKQASAILKIRLYKLIGLEVDALIAEHDESLKKIKLYKKLLRDRKAMTEDIIKELSAIRDEYAAPRKTAIDQIEAVSYEELKPEAVPAVLLIDRFGYVKRVDPPIYERNREAADDENRSVIFCLSSDRLCLFTDKGYMHQIKVSDIPARKFRDKGEPLDNLCNYDSACESLIFAESAENMRDQTLIFMSKKGLVKRVSGSEFDVSKRTTASTKLIDGDALICAAMIGEEDSFVTQTEGRYFLRTAAADIPLQKKAAKGVRGIRLNPGDTVCAVHLLSEKGGGEKELDIGNKKVCLNRLHMGARGGKGVKKG